MQLSCLQENLSRGLAVVGRAVATRTTLPITQNVLISTDEGRLRLAATNLEIAIITWIGAQIEEEGLVFGDEETLRLALNAVDRNAEAKLLYNKAERYQEIAAVLKSRKKVAEHEAAELKLQQQLLFGRALNHHKRKQSLTGAGRLHLPVSRQRPGGDQQEQTCRDRVPERSPFWPPF